MNDDPGYRFDVLYGSVESESREVRIPEGIAWESRLIERDGEGRITKIGPWERMSVLRETPEPPRKPWWRFWK